MSTVYSITQQQWFSRNDVWTSWSGAVWNMVFVGVSNPPSGTWPGTPYTVITNTPLVREKPYLYVDSNTNFFVMVPNLEDQQPGNHLGKRPDSRSFHPHQPVLSGATGRGQCRQHQCRAECGDEPDFDPGNLSSDEQHSGDAAGYHCHGTRIPDAHTHQPESRHGDFGCGWREGVRDYFRCRNHRITFIVGGRDGCQFPGSFGRPHLSVRHLQPGGRAVCRDNHELRDDQCQQCHRGQSLAVAGGPWRRLNPLLDAEIRARAVWW